MRKLGRGFAAFFRAIGRFTKRHKRLTAFLFVLAAGGVAALVILPDVFAGEQTIGFSAPETTVLSKMDLELAVTATGTLQSTKAKQVTSDLSYDVEEIYVSVGDAVEAGQILCLLDDTELLKTIADLREDIADTAEQDATQLSRLAKTLQEAIEKRESNWANNEAAAQTAYAAIGQARAAAGNQARDTKAAEAGKDDVDVITAQDTVSQRESELAQLQLVLTVAQNAAAGAQNEYNAAVATPDAADDMVKAKENALAGAQAALDTATTDVQNAQATLASARQAYDTAYKAAYDGFINANPQVYTNAYNNANVSVQQSNYDKAVQTRDTTYQNDTKSIETAQQNYDDQAEKDSAESLREQLEDYQDDLEALSVTAPIAGVVMEMSAEAGESAGGGGNASAAGGTGSTSANAASSGNALFTIESANQLEIPVSVAEYDAIGLAEGMSATVTSDAIADASWTAEVTEVSPKASSGFFTVTVQITSPVEQLTAGMSATVDIITDSRSDVFAVPYDAVVTNDAGQTVVYILDMGDAGGGRGDSGDFPSGSMPEGFTAPEGGMPEGERPNFGSNAAGDATQQADLTESRTEIVVETGFESDYYIEISGDGLEAGMIIMTDPLGIGVQTTTSADENMGGFSGGFGGMMGGGGMPSGGIPRD